MSDRPTRRRDFLAAAGAAPLVLAQSAKGANDRITFALIGAGGRGRSVTHTFIEFGGAKCLAVADVYKPNLEKGLEVAGEDAKGYVDYEEILARDDMAAGPSQFRRAPPPATKCRYADRSVPAEPVRATCRPASRESSPSWSTLTPRHAAPARSPVS